MDNLPTVVMEAMAAGLPVISTAPVAFGNGSRRVHGSARAGTSSGRSGRRARAMPRRSTTWAIVRAKRPAAGSGASLRSTRVQKLTARVLQPVGALPAASRWLHPGGLRSHEIPRDGDRGSNLAYGCGFHLPR